jgi:hypothetical protein
VVVGDCDVPELDCEVAAGAGEVVVVAVEAARVDADALAVTDGFEQRFVAFDE